MNRCTSKLALITLSFAVVAGASSEMKAGVRRGFLYDLMHFGKGNGPACGSSPILCAKWCVEAELEADKERMREELRIHRLHLFLHNQDSKKLLHPECSPYHDCYWGIYPTCWRKFPGRQYCPQPAEDAMIYETGPYEHQPCELSPPAGPEILEADPNESGSDLEPLDLAPLAPESPVPESDEPLYFE